MINVLNTGEITLVIFPVFLTFRNFWSQAAEYSNIGQNRLSELLKTPRCPFVLYVGNKKLVKRREFEKFIAESVEI